LPADFAVFGQAVDTSMADLKGGTTGQILAKATNTDMDFTWITNDQGDITAVNTTAPLAGGGTSGALTLSIAAATTSVAGAVQLSDSTSTTSSVLAATPTAVKSAYDLADGAIAKSTMTTAGDVIYRNATVPTRLGIGTAGQVLTVNSGATAPEWATPASGSTFSGCLVYNSAGFSLSANTTTTVTWNSESFDTNTYHSTATNTDRLTIPSGKTGYYRIYAYARFDTSSTGGIRQIGFKKNGATFSPNIFADGANDPTATYIQANFSGDAYLTAGDYVTMVAYNQSTTATLSNSATFFGIQYLGA
jgi:hypothetical protein